MLDTLLPKNTLDLSIFPEQTEGPINQTIRIHLLKIAKDFYESLELEKIGLNDSLPIKEIVVTGSLCNYNWSSYSDFDLHITFDFSNIDESDLALVNEFLQIQRYLYKQKRDITIFNYEVEVYPEKFNESTHEHAGSFSLLTNTWINKPKVVSVETINKQWIVKQYIVLMDVLSALPGYISSFGISAEESILLIDGIVDKLRGMRKASLAKQGEYGVGNLLFKLLRRENVFDSLEKLKQSIINKNLSL